MLTAEAKAFIRPTQITVVETSSNPKKSLTQFMTKPGNIKSSSQGAAPDCEVSTSICFMLAPPAARSTWVFFNENMQRRCRLEWDRMTTRISDGVALLSGMEFGLMPRTVISGSPATAFPLIGARIVSTAATMTSNRPSI